jgi:uncharacterized phiE125 gp8 family phage protein
MKPKIIGPLGEEPVSVDEGRAHLEAQRYGDSDVDTIDDAMIAAWLQAAREHCEHFLGLSLSTRTMEIALDQFPTSRRCGRGAREDIAVELPGGPVREIVSISWGDDSDAELAAADFVLDTYREPAAVSPVSASWPSVAVATNAVKIRYLGGYGVDTDGGEPMPALFRAAMLLVLGHLFENRSENTEAALAALPLGVEALLRPSRVRLGMA